MCTQQEIKTYLQPSGRCRRVASFASQVRVYIVRSCQKAEKVVGGDT